MSAFRQLEIGISTSRYLPARGTAGFERRRVRGYSLVPAPPPNIREMIALDIYYDQFFIVSKWLAVNDPKLMFKA